MGVHFVKKPYERKDGVWIAESFQDFGGNSECEEMFFVTEQEAIDYLAKKKQELNAYDYDTFKGKVAWEDSDKRPKDKDGRFVNESNRLAQEEYEQLT